MRSAAPLFLFVRRSRSSCCRAFTLVETVLALGIVAFCLVSMLAVMPIGLNSLRTSMDTTVQAQINQVVASKALLVPFDQIGTALSGKSFYFDQEGFEQTTPADTTRFKVAVTSQKAVYPGSTLMEAVLNDSVVTLRLRTSLYHGGALVGVSSLNVSNQTGSAPGSN